MPRKKFIADLAAARERDLFENVHDIRTGPDDGELSFAFSPSIEYGDVRISILIPDITDYPRHRDVVICVNDDSNRNLNAIAVALSDIRDLSGKALPDLLILLSRYLTEQTANGSKETPFEIDDNEDHLSAASESQGSAAGHDSDDDTRDGTWAPDESREDTRGSCSRQIGVLSVSKSVSATDRARADLRIVKAAGFKVGCLGFVEQGAPYYVSIACRVSKLGISDEAMEAWTLTSTDYIILLLHYPAGYTPLGPLVSLENVYARESIQFCVKVSSFYKPRSIEEARRAFKITPGSLATSEEDTFTNGASSGLKDDGLRDTFISRPLNDLLNQRFVEILSYRIKHAMPWHGAEMFFMSAQSTLRDDAPREKDPSFYQADAIPAGLPQIIHSDHILDADDTGDLSLPLLGMQFLLRHFVRCTEFCLVCHCKMELKLVAIKPYVCDKPLCLYQYMSLGFGPSVEHELLSHPWVVDLLVSFCYSAANEESLGLHVPQGLGLTVPHMRVFQSKLRASSMPQSRSSPTRLEPEMSVELAKNLRGSLFKAVYSPELLVLSYDPVAHTQCPMQTGQWITLCTADPSVRHNLGTVLGHSRIIDGSISSQVKLSRPVGQSASLKEAPMLGKVGVYGHVWNTNSDTLEALDLCRTIILLLHLLPSVPEMQSHLEARPNRSLYDWKERLPPACVDLLRWIVASNRSCILQDDHLQSASATATATALQGSNESVYPTRSENRVGGVPGYLHFRFAMGAPDKEQRFLDSIQDVALASATPTMFAWHGSALHNWHSIIREGLQFNEIKNGRAYGNGCYHAKEFNTSRSYTTGSQATWPQSQLMIKSAVALSEIINRPDLFVSSKPYYVVDKIDWIQTRYLFISVSDRFVFGKEADTNPSLILAQDPKHIPVGPENRPITVPLTAVPKSRRTTSNQPPDQGSAQPPKKKPKLTKSNVQLFDKQVRGEIVLAGAQEDTLSVSTTASDRGFCLEPEVSTSTPSNGLLSSLPFHPAAICNFRLMPPSPYATPVASKSLQRAYKELQKTQMEHVAKNSLAELGWYADPSHLSQGGNLYQWIVELHSFAQDLPLAQDLRGIGMQSIVVEIRFHASYPISPPFIRIVRPRFLQFAAGGGGHVTAGGSICMDLLTNSGWSAVSNMESVLMQVRMAMMSTDPRPARLDRTHALVDYSVGEAVEAFKRVSRAHGWVVPPEIDAIATA